VGFKLQLLQYIVDLSQFMLIGSLLFRIYKLENK